MIVLAARRVGEIAGQERETPAVRLIGATFFALALYLTIEGIRDLVGVVRPQASVAGLAIAAALHSGQPVF